MTECKKSFFAPSEAILAGVSQSEENDDYRDDFRR